jgi:hypothetical protein
MKEVVIDQWIAQYPNLKLCCQRIYGKEIHYDTWYSWEKIAGANYGQGKRLNKRVYKNEQWRMLIAIATFRVQFPKKKLTYASIRAYYAANSYKIDEELNRVCDPNYQPPKPEPEAELIAIAKIKENCDRIMNSVIARDCWVKWKQHIGIKLHDRYCDKTQAAMLTFIAVWRCDNPNKQLPSVTKILLLMEMQLQGGCRLESVVSSQEFTHWRRYGCKGKDLIRYLANCGFRISEDTLYRWKQGYKRKMHYNPSQLAHWEKLAQAKTR